MIKNVKRFSEDLRDLMDEYKIGEGGDGGSGSVGIGGVEVKHLVFYSGGIGSWMSAKRVVAKHGKENVILLFTDTLIEDDDLYRFIDETVNEMGVEYIRIADGRTPWEIFSEKKWIGNNRYAPCSKFLKQDIADKYIRENFTPDEVVLYLGIDWTEEHRKEAPIENYKPYKVEFPMCEMPYLSKNEMLEELERIGIEVPKLYKLGFSHNNCGGFCCRAGQGHFAHLLKELPDLYKHHEEQEERVRSEMGKDVAMMKRTKIVMKENQYGGKYKDREVESLTLRKLRMEIEAKGTENIDMNDIGGCGCFVTEN